MRELPYGRVSRGGDLQRAGVRCNCVNIRWDDVVSSTRVRFLQPSGPRMREQGRARGRVLVVDDDPVICEIVASTLGEHGYQTRRGSDAREALYLIERETPDVLVLDVHLPDISGYQV